jgi:gamma-glutamyltranspeptidase/glutathione hydrolase
LADAIGHAKNGIAVTCNQADCTTEKLNDLKDVPGFAQTYLINGAPPRAGDKLVQPGLAQTLERLATHGLRSFYEGELAKTHAEYLERHGSPLRADDLASYQAETVTPLTVQTSHGKLFNMVAPTQGVASLMILGLFDRLGVKEGESFAHIHGLVESTKQAFIKRNAELGDQTIWKFPHRTGCTMINSTLWPHGLIRTKRWSGPLNLLKGTQSGWEPLTVTEQWLVLYKVSFGNLGRA